jgi:signal transduction histidine kinase
MTIKLDDQRDLWLRGRSDRAPSPGLPTGIFMQDWYQVPALILTTLLLPAFGRLYLRSRDTRTLLWFLAFLFTILRMVLLYPLGIWDFNDGAHPWRAAIGQSCALLSSALILGSLSPLRIRLGKFRVLYVIPYIAPMIVYAILAYGVFRGVAPRGPLFWILPGLATVSFVIGLLWNLEEGNLPRWIGTLACVLFGGFAMWFCLGGGLYRPLDLAESGNHLVAALLVFFVFRRCSSGVCTSALGLLAWACPVLLTIPAVSFNSELSLNIIRLIIMAKVVTAVGLILLALENEIALNKANGERERRARKEMEAYTKLVLLRRGLEDFDRQANEVCLTVVENSRFAQAALILLQPSGVFRLAGAAGFDGATKKALEALAERIPVYRFPAPESLRPAVPGSQTLKLNLEPWLTPGDDLVGLRFTSALVIPMMGRERTEGLILLGAMHPGAAGNPLRTDDLLPLEMLTARLQAVRSQTSMLEKLIDSEKFAGLGQLAGNVTQQLNNPLTVILGYASLLEDTPHLDEQQRRGIEAILSEARQMRTTLQSLSHIARAPGGARTAISVPELLKDLEQLHRAEFLQRSIQFRLNVAPTIPRVLCQAQQLRQAVLHCLQFAMESVEHADPGSDRTVRLEATAEGNRVKIVVAHSGPGFHHPERAFDPNIPPAEGLDTSAVGLSLCATILRDNDGKASAINLGKQGAAILLELQAA